jgi:hypothetical protein
MAYDTVEGYQVVGLLCHNNLPRNVAHTRKHHMLLACI